MKCIRNSFVLLLLILFETKSQAQLFDTLRQLFKNKSTIDLRLESRNSFITNNAALVSGIRIGVDFNRKLRFGGGASWLDSEIKENNFILNENNVLVNVPKYFKFTYICYYADFVFYKTQRWQLSVPIQLGTGMSWFQDNTTYDLGGPETKYFLLLYEPGITIQFKIFKWFGLGADVGYRFTLKNNNYVGEKLNSPTYSFRISFWPEQLFFELFPKSKISQKFGPAYW